MVRFRATKVSFLFVILIMITLSLAQHHFSSNSQQTPSAVRKNRVNDLNSLISKYPPHIIASFQRISKGAQKFALEFLEVFHDAYGKRVEYMISPFAIWSLLLLLVEGTDGNSLKQLRNALHIDDDEMALRIAYRETQSILSINTSTIEVASFQAIFSDLNAPIRNEYEKIVGEYYKAVLIPLNFQNPEQSYDIISNEVKKATRGLITHVVDSSDLKDAHMLLVSSLYFKGQWRFPFNKTRTRLEPFYDEAGNIVAEVEMMVQENHFPYVSIKELDGIVLELPYGNQNRLSMILIMPKQGTSVSQVVKNLKNFNLSTIFERLALAEEGFEEDEVEVVMPKFQTHGEYALPQILATLNITDIFYPNDANFSRLSPRDEIFVNTIVHSTKIVVDEEGTVAAATAAATIINKTTPPRFVLNRPFLYLIMEKNTNLLLFVGQVLKPKSNF